MLQLIYITYIYIAKTWFSFCTFTHLHDAVNRSIFRFIRSIYMHCNHIHCKDTTQSSLIYTEQQQRLYAHVATHIHHTYIHCKDMTQLLHIYTSVQRSKSIDFRFIRLIYMHCNHIHCKNTTQFSLIYTEQQQRLCTYVATDQQWNSSVCNADYEFTV